VQKAVAQKGLVKILGRWAGRATARSPTCCGGRGFSDDNRAALAGAAVIYASRPAEAGWPSPRARAIARKGEGSAQKRRIGGLATSGAQT